MLNTNITLVIIYHLYGSSVIDCITIWYDMFLSSFGKPHTLIYIYSSSCKFDGIETRFFLSVHMSIWSSNVNWHSEAYPFTLTLFSIDQTLHLTFLFMTNVTISISTSQIFRSWVAIFQPRPHMASLFRSLHDIPGLAPRMGVLF